MGWRRGWDSNPRDPFGPNGFQDRRSQPLSYPSVKVDSNIGRLNRSYRSLIRCLFILECRIDTEEFRVQALVQQH